MIAILLVAVACIVLTVLLARAYYATPGMPPLPTDPDDPLMIEARDKARRSLADFTRLFPDNRDRALAKIRFETNGGEVEYLWGEVKDIKDDGAVDLFLITPPVTHSGRLDRNVTEQLDRLEDWQVTDETGKIYGGYTQRAMFKIAREQWGDLPAKLAKQEALYQKDAQG